MSASSSKPSVLDMDASTIPIDTFRSLIGSKVSIQQFFTTYWEKKPLHVKRANSNFYSGLFSKAAFDKHIRQNADKLQYGFDLNICVCSDDGKKIDMNPPPVKKSAQPIAAAIKEEPKSKASSKKISPASIVFTSNKSAPSKKSFAASASFPVDDGVETMTIAEALRLAEQQKKKLGRKAEPEPEEEEEEEEEVEDEDEDEDDQDAMDDGENDEEEDEDIEYDGTSVSTIKKYAPVTFAAYDKLYNAGCTVQALQPQQYTRSMWQLVAQLEELFGGLVGANCYLTPPNSQGLAPHHDDVEVFVLQLEGTKSWKLYTPKMTLPREHSGDFARDELDQPFDEINLQPGDMMYLPRGVIHEARTSNDDSAHMTISVYQKTSWYDLLKSLMTRTLESAFYSDETQEFREGLPINYLAYMGTAGALEESMEDKVSTSSTANLRHPIDPSRSLPSLRSEMRDKLRGLMTKLQQIAEDELDPCCDELSADFMTSRLPPPPLPIAKQKNPFAVQSSESGQKLSLGPEPVAQSRVRFVQPSAVRMIIVPEDEDEDEDEDDDDDDEERGGLTGGHIILTHSVLNSASHHLDGRFPPDEDIVQASRIELPLYYSPALIRLFRSVRSYTTVSSLQLELDGMCNSEGEPPSEDEQMEAKLELVRTLYYAHLLQVEADEKDTTVQQSTTTTTTTTTTATTTTTTTPTTTANGNKSKEKKKKKRRSNDSDPPSTDAVSSPSTSTSVSSHPLTKKQRREQLHQQQQRR